MRILLRNWRPVSGRFAVYCRHLALDFEETSRMRTCLIAVVGSLLGASTLAAPNRRPSTRTCSRFSRPIARAATGRAKLRRCRCSPTSRRGPGRAAIKAAVTSRQMPPWFADPTIGHFANERRLVDREIATLNAWADGGAPAGNEADAPACAHVQHAGGTSSLTSSSRCRSRSSCRHEAPSTTSTSS